MLDQLSEDILLKIGGYLGATDERVAWQEPLTIVRAAAACMMASPRTHPIGMVAYGKVLHYCKMRFRGKLYRMSETSPVLALRNALIRAGLPKTGSKCEMWQRLCASMHPFCPVAPDDRDRLTRMGKFRTPGAGYLVPSDGRLPETQQACLWAFGGDIRQWAAAALEPQRDRAQRLQLLQDRAEQLSKGYGYGAFGAGYVVLHNSPAFTEYVTWGIGDLDGAAERVCEDSYFYRRQMGLTRSFRKRVLQERPELLVHQAETLAREYTMWSLALRFSSATVARNRNTPPSLRARLLRGDFELLSGVPPTIVLPHPDAYAGPTA